MDLRILVIILGKSHRVIMEADALLELLFEFFILLKFNLTLQLEIPVNLLKILVQHLLALALQFPQHFSVGKPFIPLHFLDLSLVIQKVISVLEPDDLQLNIHLVFLGQDLRLQ